MSKHIRLLFAGAVVLAFCAPGCKPSSSPSVVQPTQGFIATPLAANNAIYGAANIDTNMQDSWGLAYYNLSGTGTFWISNAGSGVATYYDSTGKFQKAFPVNGPGLTKGNPTGIVALGGNFLFASLSGTLSQLTGFSDSANIVSNHSTTSKYTGLTTYTVSGATTFYAANFKNQSIDLYSQSFGLNDQKPGNYQTQSYTPYNVEVIDTQLYVTYALLSGTSAVPGPGNGYIDIFDLSGNFRKNLVARDSLLNLPYGMAIAPSSFGSFAGKLLVGNFGDGKINVFDPSTGAALGTLNNASGNAMVIQNLSSLVVANGTLYYTAAPNNFDDGVFGTITLP